MAKMPRRVGMALALAGAMGSTVLQKPEPPAWMRTDDVKARCHCGKCAACLARIEAAKAKRQ
jgi:hypothetical protein